MVAAGESSVDVWKVGEDRRHFSAAVVLAFFGEGQRQVVDQRGEEEAVEVFAQHADEVVVAQVEPLDDDLDGRGWRRRRGRFERQSPQEAQPHGRREELDQSVDEGQPRDDGQDDEPEPQEDVHFLVDDVQRQNAEGVVLLDGARRAVLHESTLGHPREHLSPIFRFEGFISNCTFTKGNGCYLDHRIAAFLLVHVGELDDAHAELEEGAVEEAVDEEDVADGVDKVEHFAREVADEEARVGVHRFVQILGQSGRAASAIIVAAR